jgi:lactate dehydrogenase-like 2-hydroxyacid dehydrogenase
MEALGPEGCLVNVARGSQVDEPAMVEMLQSGALGGAALDVFEDEPRVPQALLALDNVVLAPHQSSATRKTRTAMGDLVVQNLAAHFAGPAAADAGDVRGRCVLARTVQEAWAGDGAWDALATVATILSAPEDLI